MDQIEREVQLTGDLTPEQRLGLLRVADRCPVGQTLARGMRVLPPKEAATLEGLLST